MMHPKALAMLSLVFLLVGRPAGASELFVSPKGDDATADGSTKAPYATLQKAYDASRPGDTITIRDGTYAFTGREALKLTRKEASKKLPITIRAAKDAHPVFDGSHADGPDELLAPGTATNKSMVKSYGIAAEGAKWVIVERLTFQNIKGIGLCSWPGSSTDITVRHCVIQDCFWGAVDLFCGAGEQDPVKANQRWTFEGCTFQRVNKCNAKFAYRHAGGWPSSVNTSGSGNHYLGCTMRQNWGEGVGVYGTKPEVRNCVLSDNYSVEIYVCNTKDAVVDANLVTTTGDAAHFRTFSPGKEPLAAAVGIEVANEGRDVTTGGIRITNNIVLGERRNQFFFWQGSQSVGLRKSLIAYNTIAGTPTDMLVHWDHPSKPHEESVFVNNVLVNLAAHEKLAQAAPGMTFSHNAWRGGKVPEDCSAEGDLTADPKLTNAAGGRAADARPSVVSPLWGAGTAIKGIATDYAGTPRPAERTPSIGAFENVTPKPHASE